MNNQLTDPKAPVTERELDQLIWGLERYGLYPRQLAALKELREARREKEEQKPVAWRWSYGGSSNWRLQGTEPSKGDNKLCPRVIQPLYAALLSPLTSIKPASELDSSRKNDELSSGPDAEKLNQPVSETNKLE